MSLAYAKLLSRAASDKKRESSDPDHTFTFKPDAYPDTYILTFRNQKTIIKSPVRAWAFIEAACIVFGCKSPIK